MSCASVIALQAVQSSAQQAGPIGTRHFVLQTDDAAGAVVRIRGDGSSVAVGSEKHVALFDVRNNRQRRRIDVASVVSAVTFSPDEAQLVVGTESGRIEVWTADGERIVHPLSRHTEKVESLAFTRDGRELVSVSADGTLIRWDVTTGQPTQTLTHLFARGEEVEAAAISAGGEWLVQAVVDPSEREEGASVRVWNATRRSPVRTLQPSLRIPATVAISPDGRWVVAGTQRPIAYVWDMRTGKLAHELDTNGEVVSFAFTPESRILAVGSFPRNNDAGGIQLFDVVSGKSLWTNSDQLKLVRSLAFSRDGHSLASVSDDGSSRIWDTATGQERWFASGYTGGPGVGVAFSPDGQLLATASHGHRVRVWNTTTWAELPPFISGCSSTNTIKFSPGGKYLIAGDRCSTMKVWNVGTRQLRRTVEADQIYSFDVSPDDRLLVWADNDTAYPKAHAWMARIAELETGVRIRSLPAIPPEGDAFGDVKFTNEGELLTSDDRRLALRNPITGEVRWTSGAVGVHGGPALLPGARVAILSDVNEIQIRALANGGVLKSFMAPSCSRSLTASIDGRWLACPGYRIKEGRRILDDAVVIVLNAATGDIARTFSGHTREVDALAFSPDGRWLISGARDGSVRVWDVADLPK